MPSNKISVQDNQSVNSNVDLTTNIQSATCCKIIRRKKFTWIMFLVIILIMTISIPLVIITTRNSKVKEISTTQTILTLSITVTTTISTISTTARQMKWKKKGITIAGGPERGNDSNQFGALHGISIDDDNNIYVADFSNNRIVQWKIGSNNGNIVAGDNGEGSGIDQLANPTDVIIDKYNNNSLIICDMTNKRVVRWFQQKKISPQVIISDILCHGLALDKDGSLYISDINNGQVIRLKQGEKVGTIVAGGNGYGSDLNQLKHPTFIYVDNNYSVYISDTFNDRIMKWQKDAKEGIIFAGGKASKTLKSPNGIIVDHLGQFYIADKKKHRIVRWREGDVKGEVVAGGNGMGSWPEQLDDPTDLLFDAEGNLYVADTYNYRIQKFEIDFD